MLRAAPKNPRMDFSAENFYAAWRQSGRVETLRDGADTPPEKLLQAIWQHQRLQRDQLKTTDGQPVRVLHPGFANVEGGPDFRGALIKIGEATPVSGEVEVDLQLSGWRAHGHDRNPAFQNVILQVVWDAGQNPKSRTENSPVALALKNVLDAPLAELALALEHESGWPESLRGKCCAPLRELNPPQLTELLLAAAKVRFQLKAQALLARAKISGWEQALWEQLFRALGYKHDVEQMAHTRLYLNSGSLQFCSSLNTGGTRSSPQIVFPALFGFLLKYLFRSWK